MGSSSDRPQGYEPHLSQWGIRVEECSVQDPRTSSSSVMSPASHTQSFDGYRIQAGMAADACDRACPRCSPRWLSMPERIGNQQRKDCSSIGERYDDNAVHTVIMLTCISCFPNHAQSKKEIDNESGTRAKRQCHGFEERCKTRGACKRGAH